MRAVHVVSHNETRPVILIFTNYYLPGYRGGGPIRTIANLVETLGDEFAFYIVTMDRDLGDLCAYDSIAVDNWNQIGKAHVYYASPLTRSLRNIVRLMRNTPHDVLYLNSFFNTKFTLTPLIAHKLKMVQNKPVVLAPRGEFSEGAFKLKRWKKTPFTRLVRWLGIYDDVIWHASTPYELAEIQRFMKVQSSRIRIACNIAVAPDKVAFHAEPQKADQMGPITAKGLRICFLSRISPKKNLDFALRVLAQTRSSIQFHIYGPKESPAYWQECEVLISQLPPNVQVSYGGSVHNSQVCTTIAKYDLFFVPSRGENFGHVFIEALSVGVPILVSDQTPWRNLKAQNLGWDISLTQPVDFVSAVEEAAQFDQAMRAKIRAHCISFAHKHASDSSSLDMNRNLFINAISSKSVADQ